MSVPVISLVRTRKYKTGQIHRIREYVTGGYMRRNSLNYLSQTIFENSQKKKKKQRTPYRTLNGFMIWHYGCLHCSYLKYWSQRKFNAIQLVSVSYRFRLSRSKHDTLWILLVVHRVGRDHKNSGWFGKNDLKNTNSR